MNDKLEETVLKIKTPGLNNTETYVLTDNRFNTYMVLIFSDLNKAQIYKTPNRNSQHQEIEIIMSFNYVNVFKPNEHTEDYHTRNQTMKIFYSKLEIKNIFMWEKSYLLLKQMIK